MLIINRNAEAKLVETLAEIRGNCDGWTAIIFHLEQLMEQYRSEYQEQVAVNLLVDLSNGHEGGILQYEDGALVVLCSQMSTVLANKLILQLRYLCRDEPLAYTADGHESPAL